MSDLHNAVAHYNALRDRLLAEFPELAEDDTALTDTLEGISDLREQLLAVYDSAEEDKAFASAIDARIADLEARKSRLKARVDGKRRLIAQAMEQASLTSIVGPTATLSLRRVAPSVVIIDESAIPDGYWNETVERKLNKALIKSALTDDVNVPGACMGNGGSTLSARVR